MKTAVLILTMVMALLTSEAQAIFYTQRVTVVFTTDTTACAGCNVDGYTEYDISEDSLIDCSHYTTISCIAFGTYGQCGALTFTGSGKPLGTDPLCAGHPFNDVNNGKVFGTAEVSLGSLASYVSNGDTLAPCIICCMKR